MVFLSEVYLCSELYRLLAGLRLVETPQVMTIETHTVLDVLHSPLYAGAYVYGRTQTRRHALPGEEPRIKGRTRRLPQEDWPIVLLDKHPGYITWEQFCRNQQQLADNHNTPAAAHRGAVREGPSLLQGIVLCGSCGRRMTVRYQRDGSLLIYECSQAHTQLAVRTCQTMRGERIDQAVAACFLEAIEPAQLEIALATLTQLEARAKQIDQQARRQIERAQYEADLACRRYRAVDPDNRLVARSLEREWNEKLLEVDRLERAYQVMPKPAALTLSAEQRQQIRALAQDLPALWDAPTTTFAQRKQLQRWLIKDVTLSKRDQRIVIDIRWQTEARTSLSIPRLKKSWEVRQTDQQVVARVRDLAPTKPRVRSRTCSMRRACVRGWAAALRPAKSTGFARRTIFPSLAQRVRGSAQQGNEATGAIPPWRQRNCSMSTSRRLPIGVTPGFCRVCALTLMARVGLPSPQTSSRSCASRRNGTGNAVGVESPSRTW
jgi:Recombinase zinc beta ribbon domain/Recombinase